MNNLKAWKAAKPSELQKNNQVMFANQYIINVLAFHKSLRTPTHLQKSLSFFTHKHGLIIWPTIDGVLASVPHLWR